MKLNKKTVTVIIFVILLAMGGCSEKNKLKSSDGLTTNSLDNQESDKTLPVEVLDNREEGLNIEDEIIEDEIVKEEIIKEEIIDDEIIDDQTDNVDLNKTLDEYRAAREKAIYEENGLSYSGSVNPEDYGLDLSGLQIQSDFDIRESTLAYAACEKYILEELGIKPETKLTVYTCADPRIMEIYNDKDKGVAQGYENENIFFCEFKNEGTWEYVFAVRKSKEEPWIGIHSGSSYKI